MNSKPTLTFKVNKTNKNDKYDARLVKVKDELKTREISHSGIGQLLLNYNCFYKNKHRKKRKKKQNK